MPLAGSCCGCRLPGPALLQHSPAHVFLCLRSLPEVEKAEVGAEDTEMVPFSFLRGDPRVKEVFKRIVQCPEQDSKEDSTPSSKSAGLPCCSQVQVYPFLHRLDLLTSPQVSLHHSTQKVPSDAFLSVSSYVPTPKHLHSEFFLSKTFLPCQPDMPHPFVISFCML